MDISSITIFMVTNRVHRPIHAYLSALTRFVALILPSIGVHFTFRNRNDVISMFAVNPVHPLKDTNRMGLWN
jgi:hypothetical protein